MASTETVKGALKLWASIWPRSMSDTARSEQAAAYHVALAELSDEELTDAAVLCSSRCRYFPTPVEVIEAVRPAVAEEVLVAGQAGVAYEWIVSQYERGNQVNQREIREAHGEHAAHAFICAGGTATFSWCEPGRDETFRRKRFDEAYAEVAEESRLQAAAIGAGAGDHARGLTAGEARRFVGKLERGLKP